MTYASDIFNMDHAMAVFLATTFWMVSTLTSLPGLWFVYNSKEFEPLPSQKEVKELDEKDDNNQPAE